MILGLSPREMPHIVLLVGDTGILCLPCHIPEAPSPFFAEINDEKVRLMLALAARHAKAPVTLLSDTLAQDWRRETLPQLNFFDRAKLIRRRLQQAFPQAHLAASLDVKSDSSQILLAGLPNGGALFEWLARFAAARPGNPARIALLPAECTAILTQLLPRAAQDWALLVSRHRTGGFRQIVTYKGELVFTRLTPPLPFDARPDEIAAVISRDIQASRGYLSRFGLSDRTPLAAALLVPESVQTALLKVSLPLHDPLYITPYDAARMLGLPFAPAPDDPFGDVVCAGWMACKAKPTLALIPDDMRRARQTARIHRWGMRTAATMLFFAFGLMAWNANGIVQTFIARQKESARLAQLERQLTDEQTMTAPVTEPLGRLREALERQRLFEMPMPAPWAAIQGLNEGLGDQVRLVKLEWQDQSGKVNDETLHIKARLITAPDLDDREAATARYRQVAQNIAQAMPYYKVDVSHLPFPALPQEALSNEVTTGKKADTAAEYTIQRITP